MGEQIQVSTDQAKEVVLGLGKALNDESFEIARTYVNDDMKYVGPLALAMEPKHISRKSNAFV